jgi:hypothetical protein
MNYESLLRSLRIDLIIGKYNPIIKHFDSFWDQLVVSELDIYHTGGGEFIYYIPGDINQSIFMRDDIMGKFWCNHEIYWEPLGLLLELGVQKYPQLQKITRTMLEFKTNVKVANPHPVNFGRWGIFDGRWGNHLPTTTFVGSMHTKNIKYK